MVITVFLTGAAGAQTTTDSVQQVVRQLFKAMYAGDTVLLRSVLAPGVELRTIRVVQGREPEVQVEPVAAWLQAVGAAGVGDLDEQIRGGMVQVDGSLAAAWTPYRFYYKGVFSHCGANAFQLIRTAAGWKIFSITDTRRKDDCK